MFDTLSLLALSYKDFFFTQQTPRSGLAIRPGVPSSIAATMSSEATTNGKVNGHHGTSTADVSRFDPLFTDKVIATTGPKANPRLRKVVASLTRHLHDFCRENEITVEEYMAGLDMISRAGQMTTLSRNETLLLTDILGLETLVDEITSTLLSSASSPQTATAILGPFWRKDAPKYPLSASIVQNPAAYPTSQHAKVHGFVLDSATSLPIPGAEIDIWHDAPNGLYENQDPDQPEMNLRGRFTTGVKGEYELYCLRPTPYPIPDDGPAGELLKLLDRHPMRPAHLHFIVSAEGYKPLVTQVFDRGDEHIDDDVVFAVKESLMVDFKKLEGDEKAGVELEYSFRLVRFGEDDGKAKGTAGT